MHEESEALHAERTHGLEENVKQATTDDAFSPVPQTLPRSDRQAFSVVSTYIALMLFNALSMGGYSAAEAGFPDGCKDDSAERRPLREQQHVGYQSTYI